MDGLLIVCEQRAEIRKEQERWRAESRAVLPSRKSDQEISKSDFYQTIFLPKIRPKADPNSLF